MPTETHRVSVSASMATTTKEIYASLKGSVKIAISGTAQTAYVPLEWSLT